MFSDLPLGYCSAMDILARKFFPNNSPPFANQSSFITQCKRLGPHLASFWFMQVHAPPFRVHSGSLRVIHLWVNCHQSSPQKAYHIVHWRS